MRPYKQIILAISTTAFAACSTLSMFETNTQPTPARPEKIVSELPNQNTDSEKTAATQNIVETQNADIAVALANKSVTQPSTTPPAAPAKPAHVESIQVNGQTGLLLNLAYPQAWIQTKKALSQAGYPVMEQDNATGTYYILDKIGTGGVIKRDTPIYQLKLQKTPDNKTTATLHNAQNHPVDPKTAQRILSALKNQLPH